MNHHVVRFRLKSMTECALFHQLMRINANETERITCLVKFIRTYPKNQERKWLVTLDFNVTQLINQSHCCQSVLCSPFQKSHKMNLYILSRDSLRACP